MREGDQEFQELVDSVKLAADRFSERRAPNYPIEGYDHEITLDKLKGLYRWDLKDTDKIAQDCTTLLEILSVPPVDVYEDPLEVVGFSLAISEFRESLLHVRNTIAENLEKNDAIFVDSNDYYTQIGEIRMLLVKIERQQEEILDSGSELDQIQIGLFGVVQISVGAISRAIGRAKIALAGEQGQINLSSLATSFEQARKSALQIWDTCKNSTEKATGSAIEAIARLAKSTTAASLASITMLRTELSLRQGLPVETVESEKEWTQRFIEIVEDLKKNDSHKYRSLCDKVAKALSTRNVASLDIHEARTIFNEFEDARGAAVVQLLEKEDREDRDSFLFGKVGKMEEEIYSRLQSISFVLNKN